MVAPNERFVGDRQGNKVAVVLDVAVFEKIADQLDELESIRAFDTAKASGEVAVPFEKAVEQIERDRR